MNLRLTSSALALAAMTAPAFADVTSEQVWQSWVDYYAAAGYEIKEGGREKAGDTLTITDLTLTAGVPADDTKSEMVLNVPQVTLTETGDGKVRTVYAEELTGKVNGTDSDNKEFLVGFAVNLPGNAIVTSGAPEDMTHDFTYPTAEVLLTEVKSDGKEKVMPIKLGLVNTTGTMHLVAGAPAKYDYAFKSDSMTFNADVTDDDGSKATLNGGMTAIETAGEMSLPEGADLTADMNVALKAGLNMNGTLKAGAANAVFDYVGKSDEGQPETAGAKYDVKSFDLSFAVSQDGLGYQGASDMSAFELITSELPLPVKYTLESASFDIQLPVMKSDTAEPFKIAYSLAGLTLSDQIWGLLDPQSLLPHDAASMDLDLTGLLKVNEDLFDPATMAEPALPEGTDPAAMPEPQPDPIVPTEVTINQFALDMLGAKVAAQGVLKAADGGDITTTPPVGQISAQLEGVNGLLDKLAAMGLMPEEQVMGMRMMLGLFAKPVAEGEDKLTSDLEFKEDGTIFANGQQVK